MNGANMTNFKEKFDKFRKEAKAIWLKHFLPICLLIAVAWALAWPLPGAVIGSWKSGKWGIVQTINVIIIFIISGLQMRTSEVKKALRAYKAIIFGTLSILLLTPLLGFVVVNIPFKPKAFAWGLTIFICTPTTLSSGVVLTTQAKGNAALALLLVVITNLLGIATVPFMLGWILTDSVKIDAVDLLLKLVITVLAPLIFGKILLDVSKRVQAFCTKYKQQLSQFSTLNLTCVAWLALSKSRNTLIDQAPGDVFAIIAAAIAVHLVFLAINWTGVYLLKVEWTEAKAVIFNTSQKTLPVSLTIISFLTIPDKGLAVIPCVCAHLAQLFIDSYLAARWASQAEREAEAAKAKREKEDLEKGQAAAGGELTEITATAGPCSAENSRKRLLWTDEEETEGTSRLEVELVESRLDRAAEGTGAGKDHGPESPRGRQGERASSTQPLLGREESDEGAHAHHRHANGGPQEHSTSLLGDRDREIRDGNGPSENGGGWQGHKLHKHES